MSFAFPLLFQAGKVEGTPTDLILRILYISTNNQ